MISLLLGTPTVYFCAYLLQTYARTYVVKPITTSNNGEIPIDLSCAPLCTSDCGERLMVVGATKVGRLQALPIPETTSKFVLKCCILLPTTGQVLEWPHT